ncbi:hypothetical protein EVAR_74331_1 [Eumeta japonica]|uniref:Uncharacterized protein n=1 Tax=Eumeta variegata TaxID=151549 RepID=A0A4C1SD29_EUMVA|nr:hypothetical protein EVAR_74331_1 [Eumeta japonica]
MVLNRRNIITGRRPAGRWAKGGVGMADARHIIFCSTSSLNNFPVKAVSLLALVLLRISESGGRNKISDSGGREPPELSLIKLNPTADAATVQRMKLCRCEVVKKT